MQCDLAEGKRETQGGKSHVKSHRGKRPVNKEAEGRVIRQEAKGHLGVPQAGRGKEGSYPTGFKENMAQPTSGF